MARPQGAGHGEQRRGVVKAVVVRVTKPFGRDDGTLIAFDENAAVLIEQRPLAQPARDAHPRAWSCPELLQKNFMKIVSLGGPEVL